jgi:phosphoribosyl-ATP pyrophosphohydrolase/phosphoribosyl-AMP cyclohydrolase/histidinol dehydrogenase
LLRIHLDCDSDSICFVVKQNGGGFCHLERRSCFFETDTGIGGLLRTLQNRKNSPVEGSYTNRLLNDDNLLRAKLLEEAQELAEAVEPSNRFYEISLKFQKRTLHGKPPMLSILHSSKQLNMEFH